jgi:ribosome biogenesis GTPase A
MRKTLRALQDDIKRVDAVCEVLDARIPFSSQNPELGHIIGSKPRLIILNRADLADPSATALWLRRLAPCVAAVGTSPSGVRDIEPALRRLLAALREKYEKKGQGGRSMKVMVAGIPNVGKSSLINSLCGRRAQKTENRPAVTRKPQWCGVSRGLDMLDTPGLLWPKPEGGFHLAVTGAVKDTLLDTSDLARSLLAELGGIYPERLRDRYGTAELRGAALGRGYLLRGGEADEERMALAVLDDFRSGKLGRVTLETP